MKVVVDTNILFSALLREHNRYANTLIKNEQGYEYYGVYFTIVELFKHKDRIKKYSELSEEEILGALYELLKQINLLNEGVISPKSWKEAMRLVFDVDVKDIPIVALAIELEAKLWTNDEELKSGLSAKGFTDFLET
ncbi:MAG: PIN domain-containing protein [Saprospiraceae bacterium]|jgi:predicted nucleic acid-binding protein|nr:PIN domain-containing protein [Saprospiraceae bacterium]